MTVTKGWREPAFLLGAMTHYLLIHSSRWLGKITMKFYNSWGCTLSNWNCRGEQDWARTPDEDKEELLSRERGGLEPRFGKCSRLSKKPRCQWRTELYAVSGLGEPPSHMTQFSGIGASATACIWRPKFCPESPVELAADPSETFPCASPTGLHWGPVNVSCPRDTRLPLDDNCPLG